MSNQSEKLNEQLSGKVKQLYQLNKKLQVISPEVNNAINQLEKEIGEHESEIEYYSKIFKEKVIGRPKDFEVIYYAIDLLSKNGFALSEKIRLNRILVTTVMKQMVESLEIQEKIIKVLHNLEEKINTK